MAGHVASAAEERCSDCVYEIGQSLTEMVDIWGENSGIGAVSGRVRSGDSTAELSNMPGMTVASAHRAPAAAAPVLADRRYIYSSGGRSACLAVFLSVCLRTYHLCGGGLLHYIHMGEMLLACDQVRTRVIVHACEPAPCPALSIDSRDNLFELLLDDRTGG